MRLVKFTLSIFVIMGLNTVKSQAQTTSENEVPVQEMSIGDPAVGEDGDLATPTDTEDEPCFFWGDYDVTTYPNPAIGGSTTISFDPNNNFKSGSLKGNDTEAFSKNVNFNIELFSPQGVLIKKLNLKLGETVDLNVEDQAPGVYFIKLTNAKYKIVRVSKLIIQ